MSHMVNTLSKLNCCDVFRAQGWRVVPLIRLARLAVRLVQVWQCSFNHTIPNSNLKDKPQTRIIFKHGVQFFFLSLSLSLSQSPLTVIAGLILLLKHLMRFVAAESALICHFASVSKRVFVRNLPNENAFSFEGFPRGLHLRQRHMVAYFIPLYLSVHFCFHHFKVSSVL